MKEILELLSETYVELNEDDVASIIALDPDPATIEKIYIAARTVNVPNTLSITTSTTSESINVNVGTASFDIDKTATSCILYGYITSSSTLSIDVIDPSKFTTKNIPVFVTTLVELDDEETLTYVNTVFGFSGNGAVTKVTATYKKSNDTSVTVVFTRADGDLTFTVAETSGTISEDTIQFFDNRKIRKDSPRQFFVPLKFEEDVPPEEATEVTTSADFTEALADTTVSDIRIMDDIALDNSVSITRTVTLSGQGIQKTITRTNVNEKSFIIFSRNENSVLSNLIIDSALSNPTVWNSNYGFQVFLGTASAENVKFVNGNAAVIVNSSTLTLSGLIDVSDNGFGGIEVSKSQDVEDSTAGILNINPGTILVNTSEAPGKPTIWIDGAVTTDGIVNNNSSITLYEYNTGTQVHYYLSASNIPQ